MWHFYDQLGGGGVVVAVGFLRKTPFSGVGELGTDPVTTESDHVVT